MHACIVHACVVVCSVCSDVESSSCLDCTCDAGGTAHAQVVM